MLIDIEKQSLSWVKPRSFPGLMALYESNYRRLGLLAGDLRRLPREVVSAVPGDLDLHLALLEQSPYTTTFRLTYEFDPSGEGDAEPDIVVRVYHDVKVAEAMSCRRNTRHPVLQNYPVDAKRELQRRWQRNRLLNKWLEYCLEKGHSFAI